MKDNRFFEIMLVISIAGLIITTVFIALQGAQRSVRDKARKDVVNRAIVAINSYAGNNNGISPTPTAALPAGVTIPGSLSAPTVVNTVPPAVTPNVDTVYWYAGTAPTISCSGTYVAGYLAYTLENGTNSYICMAY